MPPDVLQVGVASGVVTPQHHVEVTGDGPIDRGGLLHGLQLHLDARLGQLRLDQLLGRLVTASARGGRHEAELLSRGLLVSRNVFLGGRQVERRHGGVLDVAHRAGRKRPRRHLRLSLVEGLVERLPVQRRRHRQPCIEVVEGRLGLVEQQVGNLGKVGGGDQVGQPLVDDGLALRDGVAVLDVGGVVGAGRDAFDPLGLLSLGPKLDLVEVRQRLAVLAFLPVVGVLLGAEVVVDLPLGLHEGAGANQVLVAFLGVVQLRLPDDPEPSVAPQKAGKGRPRGLGGDRDRQVIGGLHRVDVVEHEQEQQRAAPLVGSPVGVEVVFHHLGGQVGAVVKRHALAQQNRPRVEGVVRLDRLGQHRCHLARRVGLHQRVVDRSGHLNARDGQLGLGQAPARGGLAFDGVDHLAAALGGAFGDTAFRAAGGVPTTAGAEVETPPTPARSTVPKPAVRWPTPGTGGFRRPEGPSRRERSAR